MVKKAHKSGITRIVILNQKQSFATSSYDKEIHIWQSDNNYENWKQIKALKGHTGWIWDLIQLQNGNLASCSKDKTVRIWDMANYESIAVRIGHTDEVNALVELPQGILVSGGADSRIMFWNM